MEPVIVQHSFSRRRADGPLARRRMPRSLWFLKLASVNLVLALVNVGSKERIKFGRRWNVLFRQNVCYSFRSHTLFRIEEFPPLQGNPNVRLRRGRRVDPFAAGLGVYT
jgi:hypothetical protein